MDTDKINQTLKDAAEFQKDITTSNTMGVAGNTGLSRQDLSSVLQKITDRNTPVRDFIPRKRGNGPAYAWNIRTNTNDVKPIDYFYAENALGQTETPAYTQKSSAYKPFGVIGAVSNFAIEAGRSFADLEAEQVEAKIRALIQAEEWVILHGDSTVTNANSVTGFDGLDKQITTNAISVNGSFTTDVLDHAIQRIRANGGGANPADYLIVASFGVQRQINQYMQNNGNYRIMVPQNDLDAAVIGSNVSIYQSPIGAIKVVGSYYVNPQGANPAPYNTAGSSSTSGATSSNIYVINRRTMEMVDLLPLTKEELAMYNADNYRFLVKEYTTLAVEVEQWNAVLTGVTEPTF